MPLTPAEEVEFQTLNRQLGFDKPVLPEDSSYGLLGFTGRKVGNLLSGAFEKVIQPAQSLLGMPMQSEIPRPFDVRAPEGLAEQGIGLGSELAEYLPAIIATEGAGVAGLTRLGLGARAARIGASGLGFGLPMANHGAETAVNMGGVGALQRAAMDWGWKGKVAAGLLGGGAGYYEGTKGEHGSHTQGLIYGGLNALGPTVIDPIVNKMTGYKPQTDIGGGRPIAGQPAKPQTSQFTGAQGVIDQSFQQMTPAQRQAYMDAIAGNSEPSAFVGPRQAPAGFFGEQTFTPPQAKVQAGFFGARPAGLPVEGTQGTNIYGRGNEYDIFAGLQKQPSARVLLDYVGNDSRPGMKQVIHKDADLDYDPYGRATDPYDAFADLQKRAESDSEGLFPIPPAQGGPRILLDLVGGLDSRRGMKQIIHQNPELNYDPYGRESGLHDVFGSMGKAIREEALSPGETAARIKFEAERKPAQPVVQSSPPVSGKSKVKTPHDKIPSGLQTLLGEDVGWTTPGSPLKEGFTKDAFAFGQKLKTQKDVDRAKKAATAYSKAADKAMDSAETLDDLDIAQEYANRAQYFNEAVEYATGSQPTKADIFRRHDSAYTPNVPSKEWLASLQKPFHKSAMEAALRVPIGKPGVVDRKVFISDAYNEWVKAGNKGTLDEFKGLLKAHIVTGDVSLSRADFPDYMPKEDLAASYTKYGPEDYHFINVERPPKTKPVEPAAAPAASTQDRVRVKGKFGWEEAKVVGREGKTLHVEIDDPIFGPRKTSVLQEDTLPVATLQKETTGGGTVPFKDVESVKLRGSEGARGAAQRGEAEADLLGSMYEGHGPTTTHKTLPGKDKLALSIEEGLKKLPAEPAAIIGGILARMQQAAGKTIDTSLAMKMPGAAGGMYEMSGRVALNLQWINQVVRHWSNMSQKARATAMLRIMHTYGHEITHVAQRFGEKSGLMIAGKPVLQHIKEQVTSLSESQRMYVAEQIKAAKGQLGGVASKYLAGDVDAVYAWYKQKRPHLTREAAEDLAAGEFMAEIGSIELVNRTELQGLPDFLRQAIDKFKQVLTNIIDWFRGEKQDTGVAALQNLKDISNKMFDHFKGAKNEELAHAYPSSAEWKTPPPVNPFLSELPPTSPPTPPVVTNEGIFLKSELARLGVRAAVGAAGGGFAAKEFGGNQVSTAEGILLGGVAGLFGPAAAKRMLSGNFPQEIKEAFKTSKGNPIKTFAAIMGHQSLRDMGLAARYGWTGEASTMQKVVRMVEREFNLNLDPKIKALVEESKGMGSMVIATVQDALDKVRWYKPNASVLEAVDQYFQGKLSKEQFQALMTTQELQTYGESMIVAREGMTTLTQMFAAGMPKSKFRDSLIETSEKYLGRFYSAYREGKFHMEHFERAKQDLMQRYPEYNGQMADDILREHMREIQANRSLFGNRRGNSGQRINDNTLQRRLATEEEIEAQRVLVGGLEHDPYNQEYIGERAKLDWMESHKITDAWRDWLGEYNNPVERMIYTFQKLHSSAISAKVFSLLDERVNSNGLRFAYTPTGLKQARSLIESAMNRVTAPKEIARLQTQLKELSGYGALPHGATYGSLSGKWVDRFTRDEINTYATPFKWMDQPILRGISSINNAVKISRTALNPLTVVRNYMQFPVFALISKTKAGDIGEAYRAIKLKGEDYKLMLERHILGADYVAAELSKGPGHLLSGYADTDIATKIAKYGLDKALKFYQQPDAMLRASAFMGARRRFGQTAVDEGRFASLQEAIKDTGVIDKAADFTNRYTMNYSAVPRIVKIGRQLPFVNLFISYTSEITRILKNLTDDIIHNHPDSGGRMHAITVLGAMAAIPAMLTASFEGNLSPKDREDWEKVKKASPDYNRARFRLPTHRDEKGNFHYFDITNFIPADNYTQMIKAFANGDMEAAAAANPILSLQNTPLLNMAAEQIAGEDLRTGRKIEGLGRVREILKETLPPILPPGFEGQRLIQAFSPNASGGLGLTNQRTGVQYRPSDVIANYMTGMRFGNVNLATVQRSAIAEAKQAIALQQSLLRDVVNTNVSQEQKLRAQAVYKKAEEEIMLDLHRKLTL